MPPSSFITFITNWVLLWNKWSAHCPLQIQTMLERRKRHILGSLMNWTNLIKSFPLSHFWQILPIETFRSVPFTALIGYLINHDRKRSSSFHLIVPYIESYPSLNIWDFPFYSSLTTVSSHCHLRCIPPIMAARRVPFSTSLIAVTIATPPIVLILNSTHHGS